MATGIEWTDETWNPVTGCSKVSPGCKNCYAETIAKRFWKDRKFTDVLTHADRLDAPLRWKKPRRVFVNSMSDLFHEDVPDSFIADVFKTMGRCEEDGLGHVFQVLTKRPRRMLVLMQGSLLYKAWNAWRSGREAWPPRNVWLGVSVEDQQRADERIPLLLQTPAAVRFLSCEPLLGPVDLVQAHKLARGGWGKGSVDWVIVGGESGPSARPCNIAWVRSIVQQCKAAGVACFVKQLGSRPYDGDAMDAVPGATKVRTMDEARSPEAISVLEQCIHAAYMGIRDKKGGNPDEWSEDLRVREFPNG